MFLCHKNTTLLAIVDLQSIGIGIDKYCILLYIKFFIYKIIIYIFYIPKRNICRLPVFIILVCYIRGNSIFFLNIRMASAGPCMDGTSLKKVSCSPDILT